MKVFTDAQGREWAIEIDTNAIRRVRDLTKLNLFDLDAVCSRLPTDVVLLCDVLYALCRSVAEAKGVSSEEFGKALHGDVIDEASKALLEELAPFLGKRRRALLKTVLARSDELEEKLLTVAEARLEKMGTDIEEVLTSLKPSTSSPASSESTPAP